MKRFISLVLTLLIIMTSVNMTVFAAVTEKTFSAVDDIYSLVDGEGYFHNKNTAGGKGLEQNGNSVVLRVKEWICYDISDFESGVYKLSFNYGVDADVEVSVLVDDVTVLSKVEVASTGGEIVLEDFDLGELQFSGSQKKLKILNNTNKKLNVNTLTIKKLDPLSFKSFTSNADASDGVVARGADSFTINMSAELNTDTATSDTVMIKDENGNALLSEVSAKGSVITLNLKESLDFSSDYTLYIDGVKASNGQGMEEPVSEPFETADRTDMRGTAAVLVTSFEAEDGTVVATGCIKSSAGLPISGREVSLYTKGENETEETFATDSVSGENGVFTISYTMPENSEAGKYDVIITSDYVNDAYENSMLYFSKALGEEIKSEFSDLTELSDAESAVEMYKDYLGVDLQWAEDVISDLDKVYSALLDKSFDDAETVINTFKEAVYSEAIIQTEDADVLASVLDDENKNEYISGFKASLWTLTDDSGKTAIAEKTLDFVPSASETLASFLNSEIKAQLILQLGLEKSEISFESDEIMTGKTAEIKVSIDKAISDVKSMHFELAYEDKSADLFEADGITVDGLNGFSYETEIKGNVLYIDLNALETASVSGNFMTLKIPASGKAGGEHTAVVSGYIVYHPEIITDEEENLSVDFTVKENPTVTVNVVKSMTIKAPDVINLIEGDGFHNEASLGGKDGLDVSGNTVIYRNGEWGAYDISALAEGKYEVSVHFASNAGTTFSIETEGKTISQTLASSGGYGVYITKVIGITEVSGLQKKLRFINNGAGSAYVETISLERVDIPEITEVSTNAGISDGVIPRGTDRFNILYNNELNAESINESTVSVIDKDRKVIHVSVFASGKTISVDLKETLDYGKEYTINIDGAFDKYGQAVSDEISLETDSQDSTLKTSSIDIDTWKVSGKEFKVEGRILSSSGVGIKGRKIKLSSKAPDGAEYAVWAEGISGDDGKFILNYTFADSNISGKYASELAYEYAKTSYKSNIYYFDDELSSNLGNEFSGLADTNTVLSKLESNASVLGINLAEIKDNVNVSFIADKMVEKSYESAGAVIDDVNKLYALEKVNQAMDENVIQSLINSEDALKDIGEIQRNKWNELTDEEQQNIAKSIKEGGRIEEPSLLIEKIDELINEELKANYPALKNASVSVNSDVVNVGQSAELTFTASAKQENVVGICIELSYTEDEAKLFEDSVSYSLSKDLKDLSVNKIAEDDKLIFELSVAQNTKGTIKKVSFRNDIITLSFKAPSGAEGSYNPKVSGYITYHADEASEHQTDSFFVDIPFVVTENPEITVNKIKESGGKDYSGGGGASGGNGYGTSSSGGTFAPSVTDEGLFTESAFSDIANISWAKDSIEALALKGIVNGRGDGTFAPNDSVTRAEFCKMITVAFGMVKNDATCSFADVPSDSWFYTYVASAKNAGLVNGKTETGFAPSDTITREEMAAIALRALKIAEDTEKTLFADDASISEYAKGAVYTLKNLGILDGVGDNMFAPHGVVTRAMAAKVIYALMTV